MSPFAGGRGRRSPAGLRAVGLGALLTVLGISALAPIPALAKSSPSKVKIYVDLSLSAPSSVTTGNPFVVSVKATSSGVPVVKRLVRILVDGSEVGAIDTSSEGTGSTTIRAALSAGTHTLTATFHGGGPIQPATASREIQVLAAPFTIRVVPYIPNSISVTVDGGPPLTPNDDGFIIDSFGLGGHVTLDAIVSNPSPNTKVTFVAWSNNDTSPVRIMDVNRKVYTQIGLQVSYLTKLKFVNASGGPMPPGSLSRLQLAGPDGQRVSLGSARQVWLSTPSPRKTSTGALAVGADVYTLDSADYQGVNVADEGTDRFVPRQGGVWTIRLDAYPIQVIAKNVILGGRIQASASLTGPTGVVRRLNISPSDGSTLVVPRGRYRLKLLSGGVGPKLDIRVSRSVQVPLPVFTTLDIVVIAVLIAILIALLILFRPIKVWRRHRLRRLAEDSGAD